MSTVLLQWDSSTDNVGVAGYNIYRGGIKIGSSPILSYLDATAAAGTAYSYRVSAYDAAGNESGQSTAVLITTASTGTLVYTTNFPIIENPLSEGGKWHHSASPWKTFRVVGSPNRAVGQQTGSGGYDDSYAFLSGFPADYTISAVIYKNPAIAGDTSGWHEVELLLRCSDDASNIRCYECNMSHLGDYIQIVRWNGPFGNYTYLDTGGASMPAGTYPPVTGDIFKATILGNLIRVFINKNDGQGDRLMMSATDSTYPTGQPGIGHWYISGDVTGFGFTSVTVTATLPDIAPTTVPTNLQAA